GLVPAGLVLAAAGGVAEGRVRDEELVVVVVGEVDLDEIADGDDDDGAGDHLGLEEEAGGEDQRADADDARADRLADLAFAERLGCVDSAQDRVDRRRDEAEHRGKLLAADLQHRHAGARQVEPATDEIDEGDDLLEAVFAVVLFLEAPELEPEVDELDAGGEPGDGAVPHRRELQLLVVRGDDLGAVDLAELHGVLLPRLLDPRHVEVFAAGGLEGLDDLVIEAEELLEVLVDLVGDRLRHPDRDVLFDDLERRRAELADALQEIGRDL